MKTKMLLIAATLMVSSVSLASVRKSSTVAHSKLVAAKELGRMDCPAKKASQQKDRDFKTAYAPVKGHRLAGQGTSAQ